MTAPPNHPANRLARETSPYLLQHADNPVDWHPWGEEAFEKARAKNKPILLSIGYSACHWCHVMAHESFEDKQTAELMNRLFINIKLDREERPDIDKIYQTAHSLITQRTGGWPLTMFLDPHNHCPFFGGTYFPKEPRHGLPPFKEILMRVHDYRRKHHDDVQKQNLALKDALHRIYAPIAATGDATQPPSADTVREQLLKRFDPVHGGFSDEPKFPHCELIQFMLYRSARARLDNDTNDPQAEHAALYTLEKMCRGGLYDHLGGGFYRYSVDAAWQIPHFEKMLYDNGPLLGLLAEAWRTSGKARFATAAHETVLWVVREMQSPEGGYYATLDADSKGGEGAFYAWDKGEIEALLNATSSPQDFEMIARHFGLDKVPNFEGKWHLHVAVEADEIARASDKDTEAVNATIEQARQTLFAERERRSRPGRDDKILTSWNALMIKGIAQSSRLFSRDDWYKSAASALDFVRETLWRNGRLAAGYKDGRIRPGAYLDDYAFLIDAIFHLLQCRWRDDHLTFAVKLADTVLRHFEDSELGGYYFTAHDSEELIQRPRTLHDEATPSGYGVATLALARLGLLCGNNTYLKSAERALLQAAATIAEMPSGCITLVNALAEQHDPPEIVIVRFSSDASDDALESWRRIAAECYSPFRFCFVIPDNASDLPPALQDKSARDKITAYLCRGTTCLAPIGELDVFEAKLIERSIREDTPETLNLK